jgi:hypothetical protein
VQALDALVDALPRIAEMATREEREAVVAFLRKHTNSEDACMFASWIEHGDHRREETE